MEGRQVCQVLHQPGLDWNHTGLTNQAFFKVQILVHSIQIVDLVITEFCETRLRVRNTATLLD